MLFRSVGDVVDVEVVEPLESELQAYAGLCEAIDRMGSPTA